MKDLKVVFKELTTAVHELSQHSEEADEFVACAEIQAAVDKAKAVYASPRTRDMSSDRS